MGMPGRRPSRRREEGLTAIELMIVVAIVAVLAAIAIPGYVSYSDRAKVRSAVSTLAHLQEAVDLYRFEEGAFPEQLSDAVSRVPEDPWGNDFVYLNLQIPIPGLNGMRRKDKNLVPLNSDYDLYSKGKDGQSKPPLTNPVSQDDVIRANDGDFLGIAEDY